MDKKRPRTMETLARNLNFLMDKYGYSEKEMERRSGVSAKTINNMRNAKHTATVENAEKVAQVFGLDGWQILIAGLTLDLMERNSKLKTTIENYAAADSEGRESIERVAEREALFTRSKNELQKPSDL
jgi:transcriptional regulator with XRE-family HTH domain